MEDGKKQISTEKVYDSYEKGWNGRMKQGELPEEQQKVTYPHPSKQGEMTSQNYVTYDDLAVVVLVRKTSDGKFEFGLVEQEAPAFISDGENEQGYYGMFLEAPSFALPDKDELPENMPLWVEDRLYDNLGLQMEGFAVLDDSKTAVCQSFTNQNARFYVAGVEEGQDKDSRIHWLPMSSLESYLDLQRRGGEDNIHSSVQTLYPLEQLRIKYLDQIKKMPKTEFTLDRELPTLSLIDKKITNPGYRFSIAEAEYTSSGDETDRKTGTYLVSRSNAANTILITEDNQVMFLSPQQRSPYLVEGEEIKTEVAGGLTEGKTYERTAFAELLEEQGFDAESIREFTGPLAVTCLNTELSKAYAASYEKGREDIQHLDEQEKIGQKVPRNFQALRENISDSRIPLSTKYYIMLKARDLEKQKESQVKASEER